MKTTLNARHLIRRSIGLGLVAIVCGFALTAAAQDRSEKLRRFDADRQVCLSGKSNQSFDSCMKEAKAVFDERAGSNPTVSAEQLQRNAFLRCDALAGDERVACVARIRGEGTVSGSVAGGGILRELVTTEVMPSEPKSPASAGTVK